MSRTSRHSRMLTAFDGAGHGFLRAQPGQEGANMRATQEAWPLTIDFFRTLLGS